MNQEKLPEEFEPHLWQKLKKAYEMGVLPSPDFLDQAAAIGRQAAKQYGNLQRLKNVVPSVPLSINFLGYLRALANAEGLSIDEAIIATTGARNAEADIRSNCELILSAASAIELPRQLGQTMALAACLPEKYNEELGIAALAPNQSRWDILAPLVSKIVDRIKNEGSIDEKNRILACMKLVEEFYPGEST